MLVIQKIKTPKSRNKGLEELRNRLKKNMKDPDQPPEKKRFPGGVILFLLIAVFLLLALQNRSGKKQSGVSFSHQVEHLVNLDLIDKNEARKTAQNEQLVTFSGRFKDQLSEEAKNRYRYLELLKESYDNKAGKKGLEEDLTRLKQEVYSSSVQFLQLSGLTVPLRGYQVIGSSYDTSQKESRIVINGPVPSAKINLASLEEKYHHFSKESPSLVQINEFQADLLGLIERFQSPSLGIGNEKMKGVLQEAKRRLSSVDKVGQKELFARCVTSLIALKEIVLSMNQERDHARLVELRSVRSYLVTLAQYQSLSQKLEENERLLAKARTNVSGAIWFFNNQELSTKMLERQDPEAFSLWFSQAQMEWEQFTLNRGTLFKAPDQQRNLVLEKTFKTQEPSPNYLSYILLTVLPVVLVILVLYFIFSRQMKGVGSSAMSFGKSPARMLNKSLHKVTFTDVAGVDEAKEELQELVDFLKDPAKFTALGARIPKGVLLIGPPGTGKTLIAKAVAGEADRPFFSISGSDFVEMFVGVGASRIRDLFDQAKRNSPCIVFIDEIDAVGRHRGAGIGGGHDEREQTLNQLLVEMDGFETNEGVILVAATNRPDVLDKALLRPGRFDRQVVLDLPDIKGRLAILSVHARKLKLDSSVDLMVIARATAGTSGADLMNILNESALLAARKGRSAVTAQDTIEACDKVLYGKERRSLELDQKEKTHTAYHEAGHAVVGLSVEHSDPIEKVTIIPRGFSLGATHFVPEKNKVSYWRKEISDRLAVLMGGRVAEELFIRDLSSGAQMDLVQATKLARNMVCKWGMSDILGPVAYDNGIDGSEYALSGQGEKNYSDETAKQIDDTVRKLLEEANSKALSIIEKSREKVVLMVEMLLEFEVLDKEDVLAIMDGTWNPEKKKEKLKQISKAQRKSPPPPPPPEDFESPEKEKGGGIDPSPQQI